MFKLTITSSSQLPGNYSLFLAAGTVAKPRVPSTSCCALFPDSNLAMNSIVSLEHIRPRSEYFRGSLFPLAHQDIQQYRRSFSLEIEMVTPKEKELSSRTDVITCSRIYACLHACMCAPMVCMFRSTRMHVQTCLIYLSINSVIYLSHTHRTVCEFQTLASIPGNSRRAPTYSTVFPPARVPFSISPHVAASDGRLAPQDVVG